MWIESVVKPLVGRDELTVMYLREGNIEAVVYAALERERKFKGASDKRGGFQQEEHARETARCGSGFVSCGFAPPYAFQRGAGELREDERWRYVLASIAN